MTKKEFWTKVTESLEAELPFEIENVDNIEADISGCVYVDLKDGSSYSISFSETDVNWDDDY
jgi:hypothetical protein